MKKAWAFGLAAMLGLGVSTVMADQASAFAASAPPTAAATTTLVYKMIYHRKLIKRR